MTLTEEQREAIRAVSDLPRAIGCTQCHSYIQEHYGNQFAILRAMIDSSEHVRTQLAAAIAEIERLRGYEIAARDLSNDLTRVAKERDELQEANTNFAFQASDQAQEIERLRAEMDNYGDDFVCQMKSKDARIKELEDAHKRSGAKYAKIINELRSSVYANIPGLKKQWDEILNAPANGKIGPDADAKPHCWQITEERKDALRDAAETLADRSLGDWETIDVLNVMLTEADHDKP